VLSGTAIEGEGIGSRLGALGPVVSVGGEGSAEAEGAGLGVSGVGVSGVGAIGLAEDG
jgi:hypothetical protein